MNTITAIVLGSVILFLVFLFWIAFDLVTSWLKNRKNKKEKELPKWKKMN